jgi:hypothetical protein
VGKPAATFFICLNEMDKYQAIEYMVKNASANDVWDEADLWQAVKSIMASSQESFTEIDVQAFMSIRNIKWAFQY